MSEYTYFVNISFFHHFLFEKQEKQKLHEELKKLKNLKKMEIMEQLEKLRKATGNTTVGFSEDNIKGEFDSAEHDEMMKVRKLTLENIFIKCSLAYIIMVWIFPLLYKVTCLVVCDDSINYQFFLRLIQNVLFTLTQ